MKNKKIILISVIGLFIFGFISLYNSLKIVDYEKELASQEKELANQEKELASQDKRLNKIIDRLTLIEFKKNEISNKKLHNINLSLKTFTSPLLELTMPQHSQVFHHPRSYLYYYNQNLFLITTTGILMYVSLDNIKDEKFVFRKINTNLQDILGKDYIKEIKVIVKNLLIQDNKVYVSFDKKKDDKCITTAILVSNLNLNEIVFNDFFDMKDECLPNNVPGGGVLSDYKENKILMTIANYSDELRPDTQDSSPKT